ncbi:DUF4843 domain-containing protein [Niastella populi]|uniref:DUF4843 domain-containing protein n=1 Tax=Niastella populi TaxID=550983 RepID=A0A1V9FKR2_9BACT|nr:DUF4843 domain-containing protein [Niastella populi]OQP58973.1 hypothetical protein A4R26_21515 [Niastella populi]
MKKIAIILLAAVALMTACKKQQIDSFHGNENLYFDIGMAGFRDSVLYTFAKFPGKSKDTVFIPVRVAGNRIGDKDRTYSVKVIDTASTALPGIHYQPLQADYLFAAGYGIQRLPVVVYNTDTNLLKQAVTLKLEIVPGEDFNAELTKLITTRIVFSAKLEKPNWWDMWLGGYYSTVKHQLFRLSATTDDLTTAGIDAPKNLYFVDKLKALLTSPATWVANNPDKGYVFSVRSDGDYDFYDAGTPDKKFLYKKDAATGKYFFMDENGIKVI